MGGWAEWGGWSHDAICVKRLGDYSLPSWALKLFGNKDWGSEALSPPATPHPCPMGKLEGVTLKNKQKWNAALSKLNICGTFWKKPALQWLTMIEQLLKWNSCNRESLQDLKHSAESAGVAFKAQLLPSSLELWAPTGVSERPAVLIRGSVAYWYVQEPILNFTEGECPKASTKVITESHSLD